MTENDGAAAPVAAADEIPKITLGRKQWPVPEFVWGKSKKLVPMFRRAASLKWEAITDADMEFLGDMYFFVLQSGTPELTKADFEKLPISLRELTDALPTIAKQADIELVKVKPGAPGEPQAQGSTGTTS